MVVPIRGLIRKASFKMENIIRNNYEVTQTNDVSNISWTSLLCNIFAKLKNYFTTTYVIILIIYLPVATSYIIDVDTYEC